MNSYDEELKCNEECKRGTRGCPYTSCPNGTMYGISQKSDVILNGNFANGTIGWGDASGEDEPSGLFDDKFHIGEPIDLSKPGNGIELITVRVTNTNCTSMSLIPLMDVLEINADTNLDVVEIEGVPIKTIERNDTDG